jgi:putative component of membrane protein insertase Oxa1/YidC/SpoIIIJ protein YidD
MKKPSKISCAFPLGLWLFILWANPVLAGAGDRQRALVDDIAPRGSAGESVLIYPIKFFSRYLSAADGDRCPMAPSCSTYCVDAIKKHGLWVGWMMTCDRLMRCGRDELRLSPAVRGQGGRHCYDPVERNDFWWYPQHAAASNPP